MPAEVQSYDKPVFREREALTEALSAGAVSAVAGLFVSAVQNSLQRHQSGALGIFSRTGSTIALFTLVGASFAFTDAYVSNFRRKSDGISGAAGGCASGLVAGAAVRSIPVMAGSCAGLATLIGTFQEAGSSLFNRANAFPAPAPKIDESDPLRGSTQQRRATFYKQATNEQ
ncbi:hypothetical protein MCUN1_001503 [Malassezia cuniculi]|uniref:NADH dehydrogenase [ubiquinone] 1 alpha subcomplex subunit 11 n=1 Tax=Malassezia cuniculi TaxID=948313 RepID=A0AAF0J5N0_9BASI|nr:hypothetical protein MCUN1_001503 [Malassezia cuniculi]